MSLRVLIVDDEQLARLRIRKFLEALPEAIDIAEAQDGIEGLEWLAQNQADVVLLDVEMPELDGFGMLMQLEERPFQLIFQTAYDEFAIRAFDVNACDYLLKPFTDERLGQAIEKAKSRMGAPDSSLEQLDETLIEAERYLDRFVVDVGARSRVILQDEVQFFLSEDHVTRIFLAEIDFAYDRSLSYLEERLDPKQFIRLHRNSIVRLDAIATMSKGPNVTVTLQDGRSLQVSRERAKVLRAVMRGEGS